MIDPTNENAQEGSGTDTPTENSPPVETADIEAAETEAALNSEPLSIA